MISGRGENVFNFLPGLTPCRFQADADALHHRRFQFGDIGRRTDRETPQQLFLPRGVVAIERRIGMNILGKISFTKYQVIGKFFHFIHTSLKVLKRVHFGEGVLSLLSGTVPRSEPTPVRPP